MDINKMTESPLQGLNSDFYRIVKCIVSHIASGEGGLQDILNLRLTCKATRNWVDVVVPPVILNEVLPFVVYAKVKTDENSLRRFIDNPPPPFVTCLHIVPARDSSDPKSDSYENLYSNWPTNNSLPFEEEMHLWSPFIQHWTPRLTLLLLDDNWHSFPPFSFLQLITNSPHLKSIIPDKSYSVLSPNEYKFSPGNTSYVIYEKIFSRDLETLQFIFWNAKNKKAKLEIMYFPQDFIPFSNDVVHRFVCVTDESPNEEQTVSSALLVPEITISVVHVSKGWQNFHWDTIEKIAPLWTLRNVIQISSYNFCSLRNEPPPLHLFPNLNSLDNLYVNSPTGMKRLNVFPPSLLKIGFHSEYPFLYGLPTHLRSFGVYEMNCTVMEMLELLRILLDSCNSLTELNIQWKCLVSAGEDWKKPRDKITFPNLTVLNIRVVPSGITANGNERPGLSVLLNALQYCFATIRHFSVILDADEEVSSKYSLIDLEIMQTLMDGPARTSLQSIDVSQSLVASNGLEILKYIVSCVEAKRLRNTIMQ